MGNRAIIAFKDEYENDGFGVYLHWCGGQDHVESFLTYADFKNVRCEPGYGTARLAQIIGNYFGGTLSVGILPAKCGAGSDNGVYIVDDKWDIIDRVCPPNTLKRAGYGNGLERQYHEDILEDIDRNQPIYEQFGKDLLHKMIMMRKHPISYEEKLEMIELGTKLYIRDTGDGLFKKHTVLGFGEDGRPFYNPTLYRTFGALDDYKDIDEIKKLPGSYINEDTELYFV